MITRTTTPYFGKAIQEHGHDVYPVTEMRVECRLFGILLYRKILLTPHYFGHKNVDGWVFNF